MSDGGFGGRDDELFRIEKMVDGVKVSVDGSIERRGIDSRSVNSDVVSIADDKNAGRRRRKIGNVKVEKERGKDRALRYTSVDISGFGKVILERGTGLATV